MSSASHAPLPDPLASARAALASPAGPTPQQTLRLLLAAYPDVLQIPPDVWRESVDACGFGRGEAFHAALTHLCGHGVARLLAGDPPTRCCDGFVAAAGVRFERSPLTVRIVSRRGPISALRVGWEWRASSGRVVLTSIEAAPAPLP